MMRRGPREDDGRVWRVDAVRHEVLPLLIAVDEDDALVYVGLGARPGGLLRHARRHGAGVRVETRRSTRARTQLGEYLAGHRRTFDLAVRPLGTGFQRNAWQALSAIPFGETRTYAEQAAAIDHPGAARAVGLANSANPIPIVIPCHRVIGKGGRLVGFGGGLALKRWLLELESPQCRLPLWS